MGRWEQGQDSSVVSGSSNRDVPDSVSRSPDVAPSRGPAQDLYSPSPSPSPSAAGNMSGRSRPGYSNIRSASVGNVSKTAQPGPHPALTIRRVTSMPEDLNSIRPSRALNAAGLPLSRSHAQVIPAKRAPPSSSSGISSRSTSVGSVIGDAIRADQRLFEEARAARQRPAVGQGIVGQRSRRASTPLIL